MSGDGCLDCRGVGTLVPGHRFDEGRAGPGREHDRAAAREVCELLDLEDALALERRRRRPDTFVVRHGRCFAVVGADQLGHLAEEVRLGYTTRVELDV